MNTNGSSPSINGTSTSNGNKDSITNGTTTNGINSTITGASAAAAASAILSNLTIETDDIKLYDITPMDYYSKTQTALSKSQIFRDELWRRRHTQTLSGGANGSGAASGSGSSSSSSDSVDIETVLTRNMSQDDLKRLIEHQMVEAMKLTRLWTYRESDSNDETQTQHELESLLSKSCASSLDVSMQRQQHTVDFPQRRQRRSRTRRISKSKNSRRISL